MAIAKIKKIEFIGLLKDENSFLSFLQEAAGVHLVKEEAAPLEQVYAVKESQLLELEEALDFLSTFKEKKGFLNQFLEQKPLVYKNTFSEVIKDFAWEGYLKNVKELQINLKNLNQYRQALAEEERLLKPWQKLKISLDCFFKKDTAIGMLCGILNKKRYKQVLEELRKENLAVFSEELYGDKLNVYLVFIYLKKDFERLEATLKKHSFNFVVLPNYPLFVSQRLLAIQKQLLLIEGDIVQIEEKVKTALAEELKLKIVYDYFLNLKIVKEAEGFLDKQRYTFFLRGWIKEKDIEELKIKIAQRFQNLALFISEPLNNEAVPVALENHPLLEPFEFITQMYGLPNYQGLDPTPFLAPFFFLFFAFCLSDVGYGLALILGCLWALKKFRMGIQGKNFFRLFLYGGIGAVVLGAFTGSWFGNLFDLFGERLVFFKRVKESTLLFDPLKEPQRLLGIALALGLIQLWLGVVVAGIKNFKNKRYRDILYDQGFLLIFLLGFTGIGLVFLNLLEKNLSSFFSWAFLVGGLGLIFTQGRQQKGLKAKLFYGLYNFYTNFSGYLSDVLSYSRLWALGLVTGVMAGTINLIIFQLSEMVASLFPGQGVFSFLRLIIAFVFGLIVFTGGHFFAFLMNLLGAFVHPLRLQFVEFFSKFFKETGVPFKAFKVETRYIALEEK